MKESHGKYSVFHAVLIGLALLSTVAATGCQSERGGQTLPSPYYMTDDVQYFPHPPQMKLANEAAALKAAEQQQQQQTPRP
jgi:hypothetical protein